MRIGVPKETAADEHRVALVPEVVSKLKAKGLDVLVQSGAGGTDRSAPRSSRSFCTRRSHAAKSSGSPGWISATPIVAFSSSTLP